MYGQDADAVKPQGYNPADIPSRAPLRTIHETCNEFQTHLALMRDVSQPFGIVWLALGSEPFHPIEDAPRMPRERHDVMRSYLPPKGSLALEMMHQTQ